MDIPCFEQSRLVSCAASSPRGLLPSQTRDSTRLRRTAEALVRTVRGAGALTKRNTGNCSGPTA
eukprot:5465125-Alexandrium_andersonii.AAC.1